MKKPTQRILFISIALLGLSGMAEARHHSDGHRNDHRDRESHQSHFVDKVQHRQEIQSKRIKRGKHKGLLTKWEKRKLRQDQKHIRRLVRRFGEDGHYARWERRRINQAQDRAGERIRNFKHNDVQARNNGYERPYYPHRLRHYFNDHRLSQDFPFYGIDF